MQTELYVYIGIVAAVIWRTIYPYLQKLQETPNLPFDWRYVLIAIFTSMATAFVILPTILPNIGTLTSPLTIMILSFTIAYAAQDMGTAISKGKGATSVKNTVLSLKTTTKEERIQKKLDELNKELAEEKAKTTTDGGVVPPNA